MMRAVRPTTDTSASSAATSPAPTAGPCTADTIGVPQSMRFTTRSRASRMVRSRASTSLITESISSKLPPAENPLPAPRSSATRVSGSRSIDPPHVGELPVGRRARPR